MPFGKRASGSVPSTVTVPAAETRNTDGILPSFHPTTRKLPDGSRSIPAIVPGSVAKVFAAPSAPIR